MQIRSLLSLSVPVLALAGCAELGDEELLDDEEVGETALGATSNPWLDSTFSQDGHAQSFVDSSRGVEGLIRAPYSGRVLGVGSTLDGSRYSIYAQTLTPGGALEARGPLSIFGWNSAWAHAASRQPGTADNFVVAGGVAEYAHCYIHGQLAPCPDKAMVAKLQVVERYGGHWIEYDRTFGTDANTRGAQVVDAGSRYPYQVANAVVGTADSKIVVAGTACYGPDQDCRLMVTRLAPSGAPDPIFRGGAGPLVFNLPSGYSDEIGVAAATYGSDIIVLSLLRTNWYSPAGYSLRRIAADGSVGNVLRIDDDLYPTALAVQSSGWGLIAGAAGVMAVTRVSLQNGALDTAFDGMDGAVDGARYVDFYASDEEAALAIGLDSRGHIILGGPSYGYGVANFGVARLDPNGALDRSFGSYCNGKDYIDFAGGVQARALIVQPDRKIVLAGGTEYAFTRYADGHFVFARVLAAVSGTCGY